MARLAALLVALGGFVCLGLGPADAARRGAALVIGINDYAEVADLERAVGDAQAMAAKLRSLGFDVTELLDADRRTLNQAISKFSASLADGDTAFVHFSGHGVEIDGENYLLPADIPKPKSGQRDFVKSEAVAMSSLIGRITAGGARTRVFIIDACRNNPFEEAGVRAVGSTRGLARVEAPAGTFIMYSAGYRQLALDRLGEDDAEPTSVYTRTLLKHLGTPGRAIDDVAQDVRREVEQMARTVGHDQRPAYYDELSSRLVLVEPDNAEPDGGGATPPQRPVPQSSSNEAAQAWNAVKDSEIASDFEAFIEAFPDSFYAKLAANRLQALKAREIASGGVATPAPTPQPSPSPALPGPISNLTVTAWQSLSNQTSCSDLNVERDSVHGLRSMYCNIRHVVSIKSIEDWAGMAFFVSGPHAGNALNLNAERSFGYYNPAFVRWIRRDLIPGLNNSAYLSITRPLYQRYVAQMAHAYHRSYVQWTRNSAYFKSERQILVDMITGRRPWEYMGGRWQAGELISRLQLDVNRENLDWYHVNTALRYWQRRSIDGTASAVFDALEAFLRIYDPEFLATAPRPDPAWPRLEAG